MADAFGPSAIAKSVALLVAVVVSPLAPDFASADASPLAAQASGVSPSCDQDGFCLADDDAESASNSGESLALIQRKSRPLALVGVPAGLQGAPGLSDPDSVGKPDAGGQQIAPAAGAGLDRPGGDGIPGGWGEAADFATDVSRKVEELVHSANFTAAGWFDGLCAMYGCNDHYVPSRSCQCNSACIDFGSCCIDYYLWCPRGGGPVPAPAPLPAPMPAPAPEPSPESLMTLYHQTSEQACAMILANGFRPGSQGWCGGGIYFAVDPQATYHKAIGPDSSHGCILQAVVNLGLVRHAGKDCDRLTAQRLMSTGFDSVTFDPGDGPEYVVYSGSRVRSVQRYSR